MSIRGGGIVPWAMRSLLLLGLIALAGCQALRAEAPDVRRRVEARFADAVAAAQAPATDARSFAGLTAWRDATGGWRATPRPDARAEDEAARDARAEALLSTLRSVLRETRQPDGRVVYSAEAYVTDAAEGVRWHVLRVAFDAGGEGRVREVEAGFVATAQGFALGRVER